MHNDAKLNKGKWLKVRSTLRKQLYVVLREQRLKGQSNLRSGDNAGGVPPVPISNTEVKTSRADDTWGASSWESRSLPGKQTERTISDEVVLSV